MIQESQFYLYEELKEELKGSSIPPMQRLLLIIICLNMDEDNATRIDQYELSSLSSMSRGSVKVNIDDLIRRGALTRRNEGDAQVYRIGFNSK
jgi:DNA-binding MarR family transcriptional regulator